MTPTRKIPIHHPENKELLGFAVQDTVGWQAQTFFGYTITRVGDEAAAEALVRAQGLPFLLGVWQYFDRDDHDWHPCIIKEASEHRVTVIRTNTMGYQDPDNYKLVTLKNPDETTLIKS